MKLIPLRNKNHEVIAHTKIDDEDYERVNKYKWHLKDERYAMGWIKEPERKKIFLHHFLIGKPPKSYVTDHKNNDTFDNRKSNLHHVTRAQNNQNADKRRNGAQYMGINYDKRQKIWTAKCSGCNLGTFKNDEDAARAYDISVLHKYGEFAKTNGLISYEDAMKIDVDTIKKTKPERQLPPNIYYHKSHNKYYACIIYKGIKYNSGYIKTRDEAQQKLNFFLKKIAKIKKQEENQKQEIIAPINDDGYALIITRKDEQIVVDIKLWHQLNKYIWSIDRSGYATSRVENRVVRMHVYIATKIKGMHVDPDDDNRIDHINGNKIDNRLDNLRVTNSTHNNQNRRKKLNTYSKYCGVHWFNRDKNWMAQINYNHTYHFLGYYSTEIEAAVAYNLKANELYGSDAKLNIFANPISSDIIKRIQNKLDDLKPKVKTSKYRGVSRKGSGWLAQISYMGAKYNLGKFSTQEDAARAYNAKAIQLHGENWKYLNKIFI